MMSKWLSNPLLKGAKLWNIHLKKRYPQIFSTASKKLKALSNLNKSDDQSILTHNLCEIIENKNEKFSTASKKFETDPEVLINKLSFSHIMEIAPIDDPFQRFFYEFECIKDVWGSLNRWWRGRCIPASRAGINEALKTIGTDISRILSSQKPERTRLIAGCVINRTETLKKR